MNFSKIKASFLQILLITSFAFFIISCNKNSGGEPVTVTTNAAIKLDTLNIAYGVLDPKQNMDIYLPPNRTDVNTKVFVMIHGGAWTAGDKSDFTSTVSTIQSGLSNYAIININYRLAAVPATNLWPTQYTDVKAAFDYIISNANHYHYNANKIIVMGASAGAHLAMLKAYNNNTDARIKAVVNFFGPTDMVELYNFQTGINQQLFSLFMGGTPISNAPAYSTASPLTFVNASSPATIIFHGTADAVVPLSQSTRLNTALQTAGVIKQYNEYAGEGHGAFSAANNADAFSKAIAFSIANNP